MSPGAQLGIALGLGAAIGVAIDQVGIGIAVAVALWAAVSSRSRTRVIRSEPTGCVPLTDAPRPSEGQTAGTSPGSRPDTGVRSYISKVSMMSAISSPSPWSS